LRGKITFLRSFALVAIWPVFLPAPSQTADQAWLKADAVSGRTLYPRDIRALGTGVIEQSAVNELKRGLGPPATGNLTARVAEALAGETILGTVEEFRAAFPALRVPTDLEPGGYWLDRGGQVPRRLFVVGADEPGILYGVFDLLRPRLLGDGFPLVLLSNPAFTIRWVDDWDNPDGSIERGYAGRSIFFEGGNVRDDLTPVSEYARLLASVGINGCNINNVNAAPQLLDSSHLKQIARIADAFRPWGVHLALSVAIASPQSIGGLPTYDPLDPAVKTWWAAKVNEIYALIPDFAGFTVKADSEGQPGPASFGRTPADAANTLAAALAPHGGIVLYRAFVYNHHLDWRDPKADRARAAYDIFHPLDGKFAANVVVQTKEGPIDFQVREPVSPLFAGLQHTSQAMEVQITQEYTGQQRHLVYLAPMWKWVLDTDMHAVPQPLSDRPRPAKAPSTRGAIADGWETTTADRLMALTGSTEVNQILSGQTFHQPHGGMVGVAGIGRDHWLASPLALANLYAFGRLAWNPNLSSEQIAAEWTRQSISSNPEVVATVTKMLMQSWAAYEDYTGPLGLETLTDITGSHYGPNIESSERNGWGQWHNADGEGVGKDRSVATGSGYAGQYSPELAKLYENPASTPDNLLLFFHHVPYTYKLHDGKTVIQYLYDSHYAGAAQAAQFVSDWATLQSRLDPTLYADVLKRLQYQAGHAIVWRDAVVQYFLKLSGIPDDQGRAGHYPNRLEAEDARLTGYKIIDVNPWEDASRGKVAGCEPPFTSKSDERRTPSCAAEWTWTGASGNYTVAAQYFDLHPGIARFSLSINGRHIDAWSADADLPSTRPNGDNSTRRTTPAVSLKPGDKIRIEGTPDQSDPAALDYIEITP
jgi:alpha-glucuronidase